MTTSDIATSTAERRRAQDRAAAERAREAQTKIFRRDCGVALGVFCVSAILFLVTAASQAMPGDSADWLAIGLGLKENFTARFWVWRKLLGLVSAIAPTAHAAAFANVCFALVSAGAVALLYLAFAQFLVFCVDRDFLDEKTHGLADARIAEMSLGGGLVAAFALATSAPFWSSAAQVRPEAFHLAWLLAAAVALLRFASGGALGWLWVFAAILGAGAAQASSFLAWGVPFVLFALWRLWMRDKLNVPNCVAFAAALAIPFALVLGGAVFSHLSSTAVTVYSTGTTAGEVARHLVRTLVAGVMSTFGQAWWLILIGLTVLPLVASLLISRAALNGEGGIAVLALHVAIAVTTTCVLLELRFSPWKLAPGDYQIMPYAMTSMAAGYLVAWLHVRATFDCLPSDPRRARMRSWTAFGAAALVLVAATVRNADDASPRRLRFVTTCVDRLLDGLEGRDWLFTDGAVDSDILLRARERGIPVHCVNLAQPGGLRSTSGFREALPDVRLRNVAEIGPAPLLREWISARSDAPERVALSLLPDLWHQGRWADVPSGLCFLGLKPEDADMRLESTDPAPALFEMLDELGPALDAVPDTAVPRLRWLAGYFRRHASLAGNNLGFSLESHGRAEEAFEVYGRVRAFDPDNVSAVLNWVSLVRGGLHPEKRDDAVKALEDLRARRADKRDNIWSLSASCGYVSSPVAFANLGWTWALSGQPTLAANSLGRALREADTNAQAPLRSILASVYLQGGDLEKSEAEYRAVLAEDPGAVAAILGLVRIATMRGDYEEARRRLAVAPTAGVPETRVLFESGAIDIAAGQFDSAMAKAMAIEKLEAKSIEARTLRAAVSFARHASAPMGAAGDEHRAAALDAMSHAVSDLEELAGPDDVRTVAPRARLAELEGRWADARADWRLALRQSRGADAIPARESILRADFSLADKRSAARDARELLALSPNNAFANYILGSLALESGKLDSAEDYLKRSLESAPDSVPALNDMAEVALSLGKYDESEACIKRLFETGVDFYAAWDTLAMVRLARGDKVGAREAIERSLALDPERDPRVALHYARILADSGEYDLATATMRDLMPLRNEFIGRDAREFASMAARLRL